ncbi:MAG: methyltransferase domain-containing protein [Acidobacteriota bacterium]
MKTRIRVAGRELKRPGSGLIVAWLLLCVSITAAASAEAQERQFQPEYFEKPERAAWQKPDEVVSKLNLKAGDAVADIGAGSGYFSRRFAGAVGGGGVVYAADIDPSMLRYIQKGAEREGIRNIVTVLCAPNDPMLAPGTVDLVFICDTIHHITNRGDYYGRLRRCLKPGGRIAIVDFEKKPLPVNAPPMNTRISKEELTKELAAAGFALSEDLHLLPYQYFLVFIPASAPEK